MAFLLNNRIVFEISLAFLPDGLHMVNLPYLVEKQKKSFTHYLPKGAIFRAVLARDVRSIDNKVKFQMRTQDKFSDALPVFKEVLKIIEQYACFFTNDPLEVEGHSIDPNRYYTLKKKLKQEEELELINIHELRRFLSALLHKERDVINYEEQLQIEERFERMLELQDILDTDMHEEEDVVKHQKQLQLDLEVIRSWEILEILEAALSDEEDAMSNDGDKDEINGEERYKINFEKKEIEENLERIVELQGILDTDMHEEEGVVKHQERDVINCEEQSQIEERFERMLELQDILNTDMHEEEDVVKHQLRDKQLQLDLEVIRIPEILEIPEAALSDEEDAMSNDGDKDEIDGEERDTINFEEHLQQRAEIQPVQELQRHLEGNMNEDVNFINNEGRDDEEQLHLRPVIIPIEEFQRYLEEDIDEEDEVMNNDEARDVLSIEEELKMLHNCDEDSRGI